jgi:hypothetical protein
LPFLTHDLSLERTQTAEDVAHLKTLYPNRLKKLIGDICLMIGNPYTAREKAFY